MRWVLFWIFAGFFVVIVILTVLAVFFKVGNPTESEKSILFKSFLLEIGAAIIALFYSIFKIKQKSVSSIPKVRLDFGVSDVKNFIGKDVTFSPAKTDGEPLKEIKSRILDDKGPYVLLNLPDESHNVFVTVALADKNYTGSFAVGSYLVDMSEET